MRVQTWMVPAMWMAVSATCLGSESRLTVVVFDAVGVPQGDLEEALDLAGRFFRRVDVETKWTVCRSIKSCALPPPRTFVRVSIVPWTKGTVLGFANMESAELGSPQVYAFFGPVSKVGRHDSLPRALAYVMVHEILHSLSLEHAPHGVMRDLIGRQELSTFLRGPGLPAYQARQLHEQLSRLERAELATRAVAARD